MHDLITISHPERPLDPALLHVKGGFLWWYMDLVNEQGDGAVLIWSWGLPFLPGLAQAARRGDGFVPTQRPSFNLSIYKNFELDCYTLQEYEPEQATWEHTILESGQREDTWVFGENRFKVWREAGDVCVEVQINERVPGSIDRLVGQVSARGVARRAGLELVGDHDPHHDWTPLMGPGLGEVDVMLGEHTHYLFSARAYHDRNGGNAPLHELGFEHWIWGRMPLSDRELIYYILWPETGGAPECVGMEILDDGRTILHQDMDIRLSGAHRELAGMHWSERIELFNEGKKWGEVETAHILDNGPFYLRFFIKGNFHGEIVTGVGEACDPARIDLGRHRPLVKMRVGAADGAGDSMWRPLFTGPKKGRVERLLTQFLPGNAL